MQFCKIRLQKICILLLIQVGGHERFQKRYNIDIAIDVMTSTSVNLVSLLNRVAKIFAKYLHLIRDLSQGS